MESILSSHYDGYYSDTGLDLLKWRSICAIGKVDNILRLLTRRCSKVPRVLEIGCGDGSVLAELQRRGIDAKGIEISASAVERCIERGLAVTHVTSSRTPFADNSFDAVILTHVVEHLFAPRETLVEAARLAPLVVVEVPLEYHGRMPKRYTPTPLGHINVYNMRLIRHLLESTGLEVFDELVSNVSRQAHCFHGSSLRGSAKWAFRGLMLKLAPRLAQRVFTYHGTLIAGSNERLLLHTDVDD